eukprot:UC1_evm3s1831
MATVEGAQAAKESLHGTSMLCSGDPRTLIVEDARETQSPVMLQKPSPRILIVCTRTNSPDGQPKSSDIVNSGGGGGSTSLVASCLPYLGRAQISTPSPDVLFAVFAGPSHAAHAVACLRKHLPKETYVVCLVHMSRVCSPEQPTASAAVAGTGGDGRPDNKGRRRRNGSSSRRDKRRFGGGGGGGIGGGIGGEIDAAMATAAAAAAAAIKNSRASRTALPLTLMVPVHIAGPFLGRGGQMQRAIASKTGANLSMEKGEMNASALGRMLTISGSHKSVREAAEMAVARITTLMNQIKTTHKRRPLSIDAAAIAMSSSTAPAISSASASAVVAVTKTTAGAAGRSANTRPAADVGAASDATAAAAFAAGIANSRLRLGPPKPRVAERPPSVANPEALVLSVLVQHDLVGHIFGRDGTRRKQLHRATGASILIPEDQYLRNLYSGHSVVDIWGTPEQLKVCIGMLYDTLSLIVRMLLGPLLQIPAVSTDGALPVSYSDAMLPGLNERPSLATLSFPSEMLEITDVVVHVDIDVCKGILGKSGTVKEEFILECTVPRFPGDVFAKPRIRVLPTPPPLSQSSSLPTSAAYTTDRWRVLISGTPQALYVATDHLYKLMIAKSPPGMLPSFKAEVSVADHFMGHVIGRQGRNIHRIMNASGCTLRITPASNENENGVIFILGNFGQVQAAQGMIRAVIIERVMRDVEESYGAARAAVRPRRLPANTNVTREAGGAAAVAVAAAAADVAAVAAANTSAD